MKRDCHRRIVNLILLIIGMAIPVYTNAQTPIRATRPTSSNSSTQSRTSNFATNIDEEPDSTRTNEPQGIIYDSGEEADSILRTKVLAIEPIRRGVKMYNIEHPTLDPTGAQLFNASHKMDGQFFLDLGALGQCQVSLMPYFTTEQPLNFSLSPDFHPVYRKELHRMKLFQTQTPYTLLSYGSSLNKDYQLRIIHTQNIKPRWNAAFLYDLISRDGLYTNSGVTNSIIDITTNYYSVDSRYQLQAGISNKRLRQQENGGVQNDTTCWNYNRESGVPVNMYAAQNQWRDLELWVHQSFNTVRQFSHLRPITARIKDTVQIDTTTARHEYEKDSTPGIFTEKNIVVQERDTIIGYDTILPLQPHTYNTGVFALDLNLARHRRYFYDSQADSWFYNLSSLDTTYFFDSTTHYRLAAELYWTNDAYMNHRWSNPFVILFGVRPEYNRIQYATDTVISSYGIGEMTVSPFAQASISIGKFRLSANAEEVNGGRRTGDYRLSARMDIYNFHFDALSEAVSPDLIYFHNEGHYIWDYADDHFNKTKRQQIGAAYTLSHPDSVDSHIRRFDIGFKTALISDNVWFSSAMVPTQGNEKGLLTQLQASAHLRFGWFNIRLQEMVQHSNNDNVVRVPLFASKNSLYADTRLFRGALRLQTGFDIRYHTKYKADGWNPLLGAFYRQDDVEVGNYIVADYWITLQVKRASIYLKASHFNAPLENLLKIQPNYFSLPHYPLEDFGLYWGLTWKFFN